MDPRVRLDRRVPGQGLAEPPALARLWRREDDAKPNRALPGDKLVVRDPKVRNNKKLANPRPNAPLLKRIVRYPYRQENGRPKREQIYEPVAAAREPIRSDSFEELVATELRYPIALGNPVRILEHAVERRVLPTVDEWLAGRR